MTQIDSQTRERLRVGKDLDGLTQAYMHIRDGAQRSWFKRMEGDELRLLMVLRDDITCRIEVFNDSD